MIGGWWASLPFRQYRSVDAPKLIAVDRRKALRPALARAGIEDPFPYRNLYEWWKECGPLGAYQPRRELVASKVNPVLDELERRELIGLTDWKSGTTTPTWLGVESRLTTLRHELEMAHDLDGWQDVGRRSREVIKDAATKVYLPWDAPEGVEQPKAADAKVMIDYTINRRMAGTAHAELRKLIQAGWDLANKVCHSEGISQVDATRAKT